MRKTETLAYTAGIIDGEGCISIVSTPRSEKLGGRYYRLVIVVGNTNEWLIQWLKFNFGGNFYMSRHQKKPTHKPMFQWQIHSQKAADFLSQILPYLQIKKPNADLAIKFQKYGGAGKHYSDEEKAIKEAQRILMTKFNKTGIEL